MKKQLLLVSISALVLTGCASSGVVPVGKNKYMIADSKAALSW